ncbi:MAG: hypothetical protein JSW38_12185 [Dehalococcoidia bacterium]|nr:MAG: hypothetical protein JSW38_12185 [Dehalococcoidia bacterium]
MKKKLLIGILVVLVIAVAIQLIFPIIAVWIYLVWMIWRKKTSLFPDQMESEVTERRLKKLRKFMLVAGISLAVGIVGVIVHNALYGLYETEESVSFFIAIAALWVFYIATIGGLYIFLKGRRQTA